MSSSRNSTPYASPHYRSPLTHFESHKDPMTSFDDSDKTFMQNNGMDEGGVDTLLKDSVSQESKLKMIDEVFAGLNNYMRLRGLRMTDVFGILDKEREGFLRACPKNKPEETISPAFYRLQEMDSSLIFDEAHVGAWIDFMERGHRHERSMGEDKAKKKEDVRITFNEFSKCFKQYLRKRAPKTKSMPRKMINFSKTSPRTKKDATPSYVSRKKGIAKIPGASPQILNGKGIQKIGRMNTAKKRRENASDFKDKAQRSLRINIQKEKAKKGKLARKLAMMTLEAVEAETDEATMHDVPTANLVQEIENQHWLDHEAEVESEFKDLKHRLHHFGKKLTSGGSAGGLFFGSYTKDDVDQQLQEEEFDTPHKRLMHRRRKSAQYFKEKYSISARLLKSEEEELEHTKAAIVDCTREIENGQKERHLKRVAMKNSEYKVKTLLWMLKEMANKWNTADENMSVREGESKVIVSANDEIGPDTDLDVFINSTMNQISTVLPKTSVAFGGDSPADRAMGPEQAEGIMRKMQALLEDWHDEAPGLTAL